MRSSGLLVAGGWDQTAQRIARLWRDRIEANTDNPDFRLTVSAETNAAAREIGTAIRAVRRASGELGADGVTIKAIDRGWESYDLTLSAGDRIRLFDRVHDSGADGRTRVPANNGDVVEIRQVTGTGMRVRNANGQEGSILWDKLRARRAGPVRLSYGYATTVNVAQGVTSTEHIHASASSHGLTAYTALSRHQARAWLVVDEAAVRRRIRAGQAKSGAHEWVLSDLAETVRFTSRYLKDAGRNWYQDFAGFHKRAVPSNGPRQDRAPELGRGLRP